MKESKRIGIITSYLDFDKNYGGVLQAYALSKQIRLLGYESFIMPYIYDFYPKSKEKKVIQLAKHVYHVINPKTKNYLKRMKMSRVMHDFVNAYLPMYSESRILLDELKAESPKFYAFVCGSDQVWSTRLQKDRCDPGMFLKFVTKGVKKIAYAPSMGSTISVTDSTATDIRNSLADFSALSIREKKGKDLLKSITGKDIDIVLDPTLLLEPSNYEEICIKPKNIPEKYILVYRFGGIPFNLEKIKEVQRALNLSIIELPSSAISQGDNLPKRYDVNPGMFLELIKNATLVCTDSFHATVFSIIFRTPFLCFYRQDPISTNNMNGRLDDLLEMTKLKNRIVNFGDEIDYSKVFDIDFTEAHKEIEKRRQSSLQFLIKALGE